MHKARSSPDGPSTSGVGSGGGAPAAATAREQAWALLSAFTVAEARGGAAAAQRFLGSAADRARLREAVLLAYSQPAPDAGWAPGPSAEVLLGIVASDARLAARALRDWTGALGLAFAPPRARVEGGEAAAAAAGGVYLKYDSKGPSCYLSPYQGRDRGVLLQLGAQQFGHLPLGLFDEGQANPPPPGP
ncbi:hypothetical protein Rsub_03276 [Raphidocelis subcapitata]|uniref:Uncharacterized protein n=1 Tax=Raphidocelis subcapitata TaxID=307507 RepID=A0A2V0NX51_9CHLO|nr:hypothetical protein Rsub_03276 [Raphidocelis subcapitata]|eukprot:GBF90143.1 hypothetical protein Rsub_03276 [Raphidocelis subcapitata]